METVLDAAQRVVAGYRYDPFGVLLNQTGSLTQPYMFSTKRYDSDTGLIYYGLRFYGPSIACWTTRDPLGEVGGMNLYAFVGNNPVNWVDPWGLTSGDWQPVPGKPGWEVRHDQPHHSKDYYHDHYRKRGKKIPRKVNPETGEQKPHKVPGKGKGKGTGKDIPQHIIDAVISGRFPSFIIIIINPCVLEPWRPWCNIVPTAEDPC